VTECFDNFIDGDSAPGASTRPNINPSDIADIVGDFACASMSDCERAIAVAANAKYDWARSPIQNRYEILKTASDEILDRREELGRLLAREEGKTLPEGIGEATRAGQIFAFFAGECLRQFGETGDSVRPGVKVDITREPVGTVGIITPWNFPIAIPAWKIAPAICYGNTVVFKPAEIAPACAWQLVDIVQRAGLPKGVLNLVMGKGTEVGQAMVDSPDIDAISFTGSVSVGEQIALASARQLKKVQLEMGGKNPLVVLDDADLDTAVECAVNGAFYSTGQRCTASSRLIVTGGIYERFVEAVVARMKALNVGNALVSGTDIGPVASEAQLETVQRYIGVGKEEGAKLEWGGERLKRDTEGFYLEPTLFTDTHPAMRINREEIFGPVASVIRVNNYDDALIEANNSEFGLSAGICTTSLKYAEDFKRNADAGMVMINLPTAGVDYHVPFGGRKRSSHGPREQGRHAIEFYTSTKTSYSLPG
jgi:aldehyde dehydrogenase (NAD+)